MRAALLLNTKESQPRNAVAEAPRVRKISSAGSPPSATGLYEQGQDQERNRAENRADRDRERTGQAERGEEGRGERGARTERENRGVHGEESRGRERNSAAAREKVKGLAARGVNADGSPASLANKDPDSTAYWCATAPSTATTGLM